jgi:NADP-dependent 3-hydroxy acid dehydrogenase YdfG
MKQVAWITGGATGIGLETARTLGQAGWQVVISGRRQAELDKAVAELVSAGYFASAIQMDTGDSEQVLACARAIQAEFGRVDALVCSAGTNTPQRFWSDLTPVEFDRVVSTNLSGVAYCVQAVLPSMKAQGSGSIVVVSSWAGWRYLSFTGVPYSATKMGLAPLVESLNDQLGGAGVRATLVCPGEVATPILKTRPTPPSDDEMARMLKPQDVASAIAYAVCAPAHVCINELVISPTFNRIYRGAQDLVTRRA